jgi:hypothetical protein
MAVWPMDTGPGAAGHAQRGPREQGRGGAADDVAGKDHSRRDTRPPPKSGTLYRRAAAKPRMMPTVVHSLSRAEPAGRR